MKHWHFCGIDNANTDKKERLITDEVESNNELISYYLNCFYKTRKEACELINEKFLKDNDKKLSIKLNTDVIKEMEKLINERGDDNGTLYDNNSNID